MVEPTASPARAGAEPGPAYMRVLRRRIVLIAFSAALVAGSAYFFSSMQKKEYTATASLLFRNPDFSTRIASPNGLQSTGDPFRDAATNRALVSLRVVADLTARTLGGSLTGAAVARKVDVQQEGQADVIKINARGASPQKAQQLANVFAQTYIAFRQRADLAAIRKAQQLVRERLDSLPRRSRDGPRGRALSARDDQLGVLAALQTGNAQLVQPADRPSGPSSPKPVRNAVLGLGGGILLGLLLAFGIDALDQRLKDTSEVQELFDQPLLGTVPSSRSLAKRRPSATDNAVFGVLDANLRYFDFGGNLQSVLLTSAAARDGKTTIAWNLATAAADSGRKVLLIEADLRNRDIAAWYQPRKRPWSRKPPGETRGLTDVLAGRAQWTQILQRVPLQRPDGSESGLDVLPAGAASPNPVALLASPQMSHLLRETQREYQLVVIDGPPITLLSDTVPLIPWVDCVIAVTHLASTPRRSLVRLREQLQHLNPKMVAIVVNGTNRVEDYGRYYDGSPPPVPRPVGARTAVNGGQDPTQRRAPPPL